MTNDDVKEALDAARDRCGDIDEDYCSSVSKCEECMYYRLCLIEDFYDRISSARYDLAFAEKCVKEELSKIRKK